MAQKIIYETVNYNGTKQTRAGFDNKIIALVETLELSPQPISNNWYLLTVRSKRREVF
jgi:hypothetical protein